MTANGRTVLLVGCLRVANFGESIVGTEDTASKPDSVTLYHVLSDADLNWRWLVASQVLVRSQSIVNSLLDILLQSLAEILEQSATTR